MYDDDENTRRAGTKKETQTNTRSLCSLCRMRARVWKRRIVFFFSIHSERAWVYTCVLTWFLVHVFFITRDVFAAVAVPNGNRSRDERKKEHTHTTLCLRRQQKQKQWIRADFFRCCWLAFFCLLRRHFMLVLCECQPHCTQSPREREGERTKNNQNTEWISEQKTNQQ